MVSRLALPRDPCSWWAGLRPWGVASLWGGSHRFCSFWWGDGALAPLPPSPLPSPVIYLKRCFKSAVLHSQLGFLILLILIYSCSQIFVHSQIVCVDPGNQEPLIHKLLHLLIWHPFLVFFYACAFFVLWFFSNQYLLYLYKEKKTTNHISTEGEERTYAIFDTKLSKHL